MASRFLSGSRRKWVMTGSLLLGGGGAIAAASSSNENIPPTVKLFTAVPFRLILDAFTAATIAFDYEYSLWGLPEGSLERLKVKHEVHTRCARRLRDLCFHNGGIYIKLGQHISQLEYVVPQEYVQVMRTSMLNKCPISSYEQICAVFMKELGRPPHEVFKEFDPVPLASASLAQVHAARTHDGKKVAVKIQHTHMTDTAAADSATVGLIVNFLHWCFPSFDYRWLIDEIHDSVPKELDFLYEAKNSEKCLDNFKRLSPHMADYIYAPKIYWNLSTSKLLTMEFMDAAEVTDVNAIRKQGIQPTEVAKLVSQVFAEMIFKHGFVHCDPHAANMLVRPAPSGKRNILAGKKKPQLVLLDHGLYKTLDFPTRSNYAALWKALIFADVKGIKENSVKLGAGEDLYTLFAGILTMRPWNRVADPSVDHLMIQGTESDREELQMYASQYFSQISELLSRLPRVILLMLKTNDCLRAVNSSLGASLDTFLIIGRVSSEAIIEMRMQQKKSLWSGLSILVEEIIVEARLLGLQVAAWLFQLRRVLCG
ncbi:putative ABC1 protein At2g40090 isoform X1 [Amborella trichopoda]|uniref:ABC1 atypical kinase-like domain-containing protein n=1 Tax=Amborella trichopoda TaxID=13333 RepID=W1PP13_AMBTC|nr:putative ABC1 protein At2g40090 isoform X1 [Amborella trichopoda]ERN09798.1 hypothetical protein AMTR_s00029p00244070 [Amborella trichopoda]|eukprot:XP_020525060.1 putative ABC1 protein At2g40090 isoform X1 [Amborella trichopoda]